MMARTSGHPRTMDNVVSLTLRLANLLEPLLLPLPFDAALRVNRFVPRHRHRDQILRRGLVDPAHDRDGCRITRLAQIDPDVIARLARCRAHRHPAREFDNPPARKAAAMG